MPLSDIILFYQFNVYHMKNPVNTILFKIDFSTLTFKGQNLTFPSFLFEISTDKYEHFFCCILSMKLSIYMKNFIKPFPRISLLC